jgi:hypothetical protein
MSQQGKLAHQQRYWVVVGLAFFPGTQRWAQPGAVGESGCCYASRCCQWLSLPVLSVQVPATLLLLVPAAQHLRQADGIVEVLTHLQYVWGFAVYFVVAPCA